MELPEPDLSDAVDPVRAWVATAVGAAALIAVAAVSLPGPVYDGFLWRYFWGPVVADAHSAACVIRQGASVELLYDPGACGAAGGIVASPGYTTVSTVSYAAVLVFMLVGVLLLLNRMKVSMSPAFFYALFPYMLLGGALRTVEDVNATFMREGIGAPIPFPPSALIISPFIYFVMFVFTLAVLVGALVLVRRGVVDRYEPVLGAAGGAALAVVVGWLLAISATSAVVEFHALVPAITLVGATLVAGAAWALTERYAPIVNEGTGYMGALVVWGHTVDGIANVLVLDWAAALGLPLGYSPKHVVNRLLVDVAGAVQPRWLTETVGTAWPFFVLKVTVAVGVVWIFDRRLFEESPRYAYLLFIAILAVGLGPGTRDMLRATLGI